MLLSTPRSFRYRKRLSSLLPWSRCNPIPPILFAGDDGQFERERRRELQLTLDKLEGRVLVNAEGKLQRVGSNDGALNNACGLMSMLSDKLIDIGISEPKAGGSRLDNSLDGKAFGDWAVGRQRESSSELESYGCGDLNCDGNSDGIDARQVDTRDLSVIAPKNITHPAFSWLLDDEERWETSSRISEDSLFDDHMRQPPESQFNDVDKAVTRFSSLGATMKTLTTTIPFYRDSLCPKILSESWPQAPVGLNPEKAPVDGWSATRVEELNVPRALSCVSQIPCSTTLTQAEISVFQGKPSFMKRVIKAIVQPMETLVFRNMKHHIKPFNRGPTKGKTLEKHPENDDVASSNHSGTSKSAAKKVVFNDKIGYRLFRKDSLCVESFD